MISDRDKKKIWERKDTLGLSENDNFDAKLHCMSRRRDFIQSLINIHSKASSDTKREQLSIICWDWKESKYWKNFIWCLIASIAQIISKQGFHTFKSLWDHRARAAGGILKCSPFWLGMWRKKKEFDSLCYLFVVCD